MKKARKVQLHNAVYKGKLISGEFVTPAKAVTVNTKTGNTYCPIIHDNIKRFVRITSTTTINFLPMHNQSIAESQLNSMSFNLDNNVADITPTNDLSTEVLTTPTFFPPVELPVESLIEVVAESEESVLDRIRDRFAILTRLVNGVCQGAIKALVVSGPPGVGKTHGVEKQLKERAEFGNYKYEFIKGTASPVYIYQKLYEFADKKSILVFDDCDSVFFEPISLNLFKAALDSSKERIITWGTESRILKEKDIPNSFKFEGAVIFISNLKFDAVRSPALKEHLAAIESRCHYLDLTIDTPRDKMLRIKQVVRDSSMLDEYGFDEERKQEIVDYVQECQASLRELSLRTVTKLADLAVYTDDWKMIADITLKRGSVFKSVSNNVATAI